jgi:hypothetical protein
MSDLLGLIKGNAHGHPDDCVVSVASPSGRIEMAIGTFALGTKKARARAGNASSRILLYKVAKGPQYRSCLTVWTESLQTQHLQADAFSLSEHHALAM